MLYLHSNQTESKPSRTGDKSARKACPEQRRRVTGPVLSFVEGTQKGVEGTQKGYAIFFCGILNVFALICTKEEHSEN